MMGADKKINLRALVPLVSTSVSLEKTLINKSGIPLITTQSVKAIRVVYQLFLLSGTVPERGDWN
ncbi:MAG TPA: hypothetical protein VFC84_01855 [Desulfosporosinus sp.]|nr:hypothetical protein [Desulfosporosinus sp.]